MPTTRVIAKKAVAAPSTEKKADTRKSQKVVKKPSASAPSVASSTAVPAKKKRPPRKPVKPQRVEDLDSPYPVPAQVIPVLGAAYGLGRRHIEDGLTYVFERWADCNVGDVYESWMNGILMATGRVTTANEDDLRFFLVIPRTSLLLYVVEDVFGQVTRVASDSISTSVPQRILILNTLPGGEGNCDGTYHRGLTFELSDTFVDAVVAARGVTVTIRNWENMRVNDLVMFFWGGERFDALPPIRKDQVGLDLIFTIDHVFLEAVGSGHFVVQFHLYDEVLDVSGPCHRWSKPISVDVDLDLTLLMEPEIVEADPVTQILDADALHNLPGTASVLISNHDPNFIASDFILWKVSGTTVEGEEVSYSVRKQVQLRTYNDAPISNPIIRLLIESTIKIMYYRERGMLPSRASVYTVAGARYLLPKPDVLQREGPFVPANLPYMTVAMADYQGNAGDDLRVDLVAEKLDGTLKREFSHRAAGAHPRLRDFLNALYAPFEGLRNTRVYYKVTGPATVRESARRYIQIGKPAATLVTPRIQEADHNRNIDPNTIGSVATFEARTEFRASDEVIITYVGSVTGVSTVPYVLAVDSNPFLADIPRKRIEDNLDGTLRVNYVRTRFGVSELSGEEIYTIGQALGALFLPEVVEATTAPDELDPRRVVLAGATVRCRYDEPRDGDKVEVCWCGLAGGGTHFETRDANSGDPHVDVTVPPEAIGYNIHPFGRDIAVSFKVIRNGFPNDSPVLTLKLLTLSHVPGATIDSIGDSAILEIPRLNDLDQTRVLPWPCAAVGQRMYLRYKGTFKGGMPYEEDTFVARAATLADVMAGPAPYTPVGRLSNLKEWTALTIEFGVTFNHSSDTDEIVWFDTRRHMVQTEPNIFPRTETKYSTPPSGSEVIIHPLTVENKCQVLVTYPNMNQGGTDMITLWWILADGTPIEIGTLPGLAGGTVTFNVGNDVVGRSIFSTIQLQYEVILGRGGDGSSDVQKVHVQAIPQGSLPRALINRIAHGGSINPAGLTSDAMLAMAKWAYSGKDQFAWLKLSAPGATPQDLLVAHSVTANEAANGFANIRVLRSWLLSIPNNRTLTVTPHINFAKQADKSRAVAFPSTQYQINTTTALVFNASPVYLDRQTYLLAGSNVFPAFGPGNQVQHQASGGTRPYTYSGSNGSVIHVNSGSGLVQVRGNGSAVVSVRDSSVPAQTRSYTVVVRGVIWVQGLGRNTFGNIRAAANNAGVRLPSLDEARALHAAYGNSWPMGFANYWTGTLSHSFFFSNYYYTVNLNTGETLTGKDSVVGDHCNGVGLR